MRTPIPINNLIFDILLCQEHQYGVCVLDDDNSTLCRVRVHMSRHTEYVLVLC